MKTVRSMVLVSSDPVSMERGAQEVHDGLLHEIEAFGLSNEIDVMLVGDLGRHDALLGRHGALARIEPRNPTGQLALGGLQGGGNAALI